MEYVISGSRADSVAAFGEYALDGSEAFPEQPAAAFTAAAC